MTRKFDKQTIASINGLARQFSDATVLMHEAIARKVGLSGVDHKYLGILMQKEEMTAGELSTLTGLTTGAVTGLIDRLEKKKLVKRKFDKDDRRKVLIVPDTEKVKQLFSGVFSEGKSETINLLEQFNEDEVDIIKRYMTSAIVMMKERTDKLNKKGKEKEKQIKP